MSIELFFGALAFWVVSVVGFSAWAEHIARREEFQKGWSACEQYIRDMKEAKRQWRKFNRKGD